MDFGNILDKWEQQNTAEADSKNTQPMDEWLRVNGVYDKDADIQGKQNGAAERRRLRHKKPDIEIDIHGFTRDEAWKALEHFFSEAKNQGFEKVLIIHGKGNHSAGDAVLKRVTREFIERCPFAGESGRGKAAAGGEGATWVLLKA
jgi:DNA-nicking Smr family endonuclease